jgi:allantoinase
MTSSNDRLTSLNDRPPYPDNRATSSNDRTISSNDRLMFASMVDRPRVTWPEGKTVAFWHSPNVEHYDWIAPNDAGPKNRVALPDAQFYMPRDYGNRVAFWRMLRSIDEFEMPATVSLSLALLQEVPEVRDAMLERDWEIMSHGISNLRALTGYSVEEEDAFFDTSQELSRRYYGGRTIRGMLAPRISGTDNTPDLMAKHGMTYHADWVHDEQPRPLRTTSTNKLVSMPYSFTTNDVPAVGARAQPIEYFVELFEAQLDRLLRDADEDGQGRVLCVATHPYVMAQPHADRYLRQIFERVRSESRVWVTTAGAIAGHYIENSYDEQAAFADGLLAELGGVRA